MVAFHAHRSARAARPPRSNEAVSRAAKRPACLSLSILSLCTTNGPGKSAWDPLQGKMCSPDSFFRFAFEEFSGSQLSDCQTARGRRVRTSIRALLFSIFNDCDCQSRMCSFIEQRRRRYCRVRLGLPAEVAGRAVWRQSVCLAGCESTARYARAKQASQQCAYRGRQADSKVRGGV